ncbi:2-hydroxyacid dehydrogenase [Pseudovirgaria hyperparasitica]|uniref:2-hydroxyacid dehydrogenase n=1 Tax=Pseudovirgaria hyperparasitica TaxID=470096 RepID=A0A6A6W123_9PEZI|nr:2-hydroxyacid dehydrogenase [Pseudovirgaria hyperparasitica]KAF2756618.1 2-hydroxyacid dehydrogenase [Pseudovirgaria hyperparasitica]
MGGGPKETLLVAIEFPESKELVDRMRKKFPYVDIVWYQHDPKKGPVPEHLFRSVTILVTMFSLPSKLSLVPELRYVHFFSAGINHIYEHPLYKDSKIPLTTSNGVHGPQIAEWVVMTALCQNHSYNHWHALQQQKKWGNFRDVKVRDWAGQKVGILGYGSIGRQVGRAFAALGMTIYAYTASPRPTPSSRVDNGYIVPNTGDPDGSIPTAWYSGTSKASLHDFLSQKFDIIVLTLPLTPSTTHLLGTEEFAILASQPHPPLLSNISRGQIVDQAAMVKALHDGGLRGACLDVTDPEPLPEDSELWTAKNVIITPHVSGGSEKYLERTWDILEMNVGRLMEGKKLINQVDRRRGY